MRAFVKWGAINRPVSPLGWMVTALAILFMAQVFVAMDARAHSVSDLLYGLYPFWVPTLLLWDWVARRMAGD